MNKSTFNDIVIHAIHIKGLDDKLTDEEINLLSCTIYSLLKTESEREKQQIVEVDGKKYNVKTLEITNVRKCDLCDILKNNCERYCGENEYLKRVL